MKKNLLFIAFLFAAVFAYAQNPTWEWAKTATGAGHTTGAATDAAGNCYITGVFFGNSITFDTITLTKSEGDGTCDVYFVKYNAEGNVLWAKSACGAYDVNGMGVATDALGNVYVTGHFFGDTLTFDGTTKLTNANQTVVHGDIYIAKYDTDGNLLWAKRAGGKLDEMSMTMAADAAGNCYIGGYTDSNDFTFGTSTLSTTGIYIAKYDTDGNELWIKGSDISDWGFVRSVAVDASGNCYMAGFIFTNILSFGSVVLENTSGQSGAFLMKFDTDGNAIWGKMAQSPGVDLDGYAVAVDASQNVYWAGDFTIGELTLGSVTLTNTAGYRDLFLVKYDAAGNVLWANSADGDGGQYPWSLAVDASGNIYEAGYFDGAAVTIGANTLISAGDNEAFLAKYDADGNVLGAVNIGSVREDVARPVVLDSYGNGYIGGWFCSATTNFGDISLDGLFGGDIFLAKFNCNSLTATKELSKSQIPVSVYPNPTKNIATVSYAVSETDNIVISLTDITGKQIKTIYKGAQAKGSHNCQVDLSQNPKGIYLVNLKTSKGNYVQKISKME
jgi:hypothetical protein